jgi:hypothetical protein
MVAPAATVLPVAELLNGAALLLCLVFSLPAAVGQIAALAANLLLLLFAGAMSINIQRGRRHIDCGCGHAGLRQQLSLGQVVRNILLALGLLPLIGGGAAALIGTDLVVAMVAGFAVYLLLLLFTTLNAVAELAPGRARG